MMSIKMVILEFANKAEVRCLSSDSFVMMAFLIDRPLNNTLLYPIVKHCLNYLPKRIKGQRQIGKYIHET